MGNTYDDGYDEGYDEGCRDGVLAVSAESAATIAALRATVTELCEACERLAMSTWALGTIEDFESTATRFLQETGMLAPGKDMHAQVEYTEEEREARWLIWNKEGRVTARAVIAKAREATAHE